MLRPIRTATLALALSLASSACFEGPQRLDPQAPHASRPLAATQPAARDGGLPEGHPPINPQLPPGHPPLQGSGDPHGPHGQASPPHGMPRPGHAPTGEVLFAGRVELMGPIAQQTRGGVFLIARAPGQGGSLLVRKLEVADGELREDGTRVLAFELSDQDSHGTPIPAEVLLEVYFDPDGIVETREGRVGSTSEAKRGDLELRIVLDPAAAGGEGGY